MPVRKRTVLVDQRISRSRLSAETNPQELLEQQRAMQVLEQQRAIQIPQRPASPSPAMSRMSSLGLGAPVPRKLPVEEEGNVKVVPPTPEPPKVEAGKMADPPSPPEDESITSPTASILESMEESTGPADEAPLSVGAAGLKRATSGEVTRMRGPRGEGEARL